MAGHGETSASKPPEVDPDVLFRRVEDELVLVKISTNEIYALNPTGARIWELISEGSDVDGAVTRLLDEYDEPEKTVRANVESFVSELRTGGFLLP